MQSVVGVARTMVLLLSLVSCRPAAAFSFVARQSSSRRGGGGVWRCKYYYYSSSSTSAAVLASKRQPQEDEDRIMDNVKLRHAAFDALIFDQQEEEETKRNDDNTNSIPKASTFSTPQNEYNDNVESPFDFGTLEQDYNEPSARMDDDNSKDSKNDVSNEDIVVPFDFGDDPEQFDPSKVVYSLSDFASKQQQQQKQEPVRPKRVVATMPPPPLLVDLKKKSEIKTKQDNNNNKDGLLMTTTRKDDIFIRGSSGQGVSTDAQVLQSRLVQLESEIYARHGHVEFNLNSPKQVSHAIFGKDAPVQSTNKETLEAMGAAGNTLADLILQWRSTSRAIRRAQKKQQEGKKNHVNILQSGQGQNITNEEEDALLLVDASAYIFRAYYSMPPLHRADGMPVGAVLGFCNMLNRLVLHRLLNGDCPRLVLVFDAKGKTFRHDLYPEYKANRKDCPMDLIPQFDLIRHVATAYGIPQVEAPTYEADDVIATLATMALKDNINVNILSGDKDLMQLVTPENISPRVNMIDPMSMTRIDYDAVVEKWGVPPELVGDLLALAGDASDNIPGVPGIGPKIASQLLHQFGSLSQLLQEAETKIPQTARRETILHHTDKALLSRQLVELERDIPVQTMTLTDNHKVADLRMQPMDTDRVAKLYETMGFKDLRRRFQDRVQQRDKTSAASSVKKKTKKKSFYKNNKKAEIPKPEDYDQVPF